jgi:hypothetical protein
MTSRSIPMTIRLAGVLCLAAALWATPTQAQRMSDEEIRKILIEESLASYSEPCPCPYSYARNGSQCAGASAYSMLKAPYLLCYAADVTQHMIHDYRARRGIR